MFRQFAGERVHFTAQLRLAIAETAFRISYQMLNVRGSPVLSLYVRCCRFATAHTSSMLFIAGQGYFHILFLPNALDKDFKFRASGHTCTSLRNYRGLISGRLRLWKPTDLHFGAGNSFSVPQLSSHSVTRLLETLWPASNSAMPARMCLRSPLLGETSERVFPTRTMRAVMRQAPWRESYCETGLLQRIAVKIAGEGLMPLWNEIRFQ